MKRFASIDIGTQTIRLLIADCDESSSMVPLFRDRQIIRLGEGMSSNNGLGAEPVNRAVKCISSFKRTCDQYDVEKIFASSTACVREASNSNDFISSVFKETGITPVVLSGEDEALLSLKGVQSVTRSFNTSLVIDIGGGSTELILTDKGESTLSESIKLGVVSLAEKFLKNDPPLSRETDNIIKIINSKLISGSKIINESANKKIHQKFIGTAGTVTTLAAMDLKMTDYDPERINGHTLTKGKIRTLLDKMVRLSSAERSLITGLEKGREVVIIPGTLILLAILEFTDCEQLIVSDSGLLEGILLDNI